MDTKQVKKIAKTEVKAHEKRMHGSKMAKGGVTTESMKKYGRNMARVMNQTGSKRGG
jgi:antitoxin component HigA of HigAB toxin-antitoxin module